MKKNRHFGELVLGDFIQGASENQHEARLWGNNEIPNEKEISRPYE